MSLHSRDERDEPSLSITAMDSVGNPAVLTSQVGKLLGTSPLTTLHNKGLPRRKYALDGCDIDLSATTQSLLRPLTSEATVSPSSHTVSPSGLTGSLSPLASMPSSALPSSPQPFPRSVSPHSPGSPSPLSCGKSADQIRLINTNGRSPTLNVQLTPIRASRSTPRPSVSGGILPVHPSARLNRPSRRTPPRFKVHNANATPRTPSKLRQCVTADDVLKLARQSNSELTCAAVEPLQPRRDISVNTGGDSTLARRRYNDEPSKARLKQTSLPVQKRPKTRKPLAASTSLPAMTTKELPTTLLPVSTVTANAATMKPYVEAGSTRSDQTRLRCWRRRAAFPFTSWYTRRDQIVSSSSSNRNDGNALSISSSDFGQDRLLPTAAFIRRKTSNEQGFPGDSRFNRSDRGRHGRLSTLTRLTSVALPKMSRFNQTAAVRKQTCRAAVPLLARRRDEQILLTTCGPDHSDMMVVT